MKNPAYLKNVVTLQLDEIKCTGCGMCLDVCPHEVFKMNNGAPHTGAFGSFPKNDIPPFAESVDPPANAGSFLRRGKHIMIQNRDACMECGACSLNCPANAIAVQSGVGCANAVINSMLGRNNGECCCGPVDTDSKATSDKGCCC